MTRDDLCALANSLARESRRPGAPFLAPDYSLPALRAWLAWNDGGNGEWHDDDACEDLTLDDAWEAIADGLQ